MIDLNQILGILGKKEMKEFVVQYAGTYVLDFNPAVDKIIVFKGVFLEGDDIGEFGIYFGNANLKWLPAIRDIAPGGAGIFGYDNLYKVVTNQDVLRIQFSKQTDTGYIYMNVDYFIFDSDEFNKLKEFLKRYLFGGGGVTTIARIT